MKLNSTFRISFVLFVMGASIIFSTGTEQINAASRSISAEAKALDVKSYETRIAPDKALYFIYSRVLNKAFFGIECNGERSAYGIRDITTLATGSTFNLVMNNKVGTPAKQIIAKLKLLTPDKALLELQDDSLKTLTGSLQIELSSTAANICDAACNMGPGGGGDWWRCFWCCAIFDCSTLNLPSAGGM